MDLRVVVVEVGLMGEEAMPVVGTGHRVIGPVGDLGVGEDDPRVLVALVGVRPHVPVALGAVGAAERDSPETTGGRDEVWFMTRSAMTRMRRAWAASIRSCDVVDGPVVGVDLGEVRDVIAAVAQRRLVEGQQPDAVDPQPLQVVELLGEPADVPGAVAVGIEEAADVDLVEDRALEPQRLGLEPLAGLAWARWSAPPPPRCAAPARSRARAGASASGGRRSSERTPHRSTRARAPGAYPGASPTKLGPIRHW